MKHLKLFEDFNYDALVKEANMYRQIKDLPTDGNADIGEQFEVLAWTMALDRSGYSALNNFQNKVAHIRWSSIFKDHGKPQKRYGIRGDVPDFMDKHHLRDNYAKNTCKFEDYFEILPNITGIKQENNTESKYRTLLQFYKVSKNLVLFQIVSTAPVTMLIQYVMQSIL